MCTLIEMIVEMRNTPETKMNFLPLSLYLSLIKVMNTKVLKLCMLKYT